MQLRSSELVALGEEGVEGDTRGLVICVQGKEMMMENKVYLLRCLREQNMSLSVYLKVFLRKRDKYRKSTKQQNMMGVVYVVWYIRPFTWHTSQR